MTIAVYLDYMTIRGTRIEIRRMREKDMQLKRMNHLGHVVLAPNLPRLLVIVDVQLLNVVGSHPDPDRAIIQISL